MRQISIQIVVFVLVFSTVLLGGSYSLRSGDGISINVFGHPEFSTEALVAPDGTISVPRIGIVDVEGISLSNLETLLAEAFVERDILRTRPQITVSVTRFSDFNYNVLGEVNNPGTILLKESQVSISRVLGLAGGFRQTADPSATFIIRSDGTKEVIDLSRLISQGTGADIVMNPDDTLFVPSGVESWINVIGEVRNPGTVPFREGLTLIQVIAASGGLTASADPERVLLVVTEGDKRVQKTLSLSDIIESESPDPELSKGTTIIIPDLTLKSIRVIGEVRNPANVRFVRGMSLLQVIGQVGGITADAADLVLVLRSSGFEPDSYQLTKLMSGESKDPLLEPGDTVVVPREVERFVYVVSRQQGGRVDFSRDEDLTARVLLAKLNLSYENSEQRLIIFDKKGDRVSHALRSFTDEDIMLDPGSIVMFPDFERDIHVFGAIRHPGQISFPLDKEPDLITVISMAGGLLDDANSSAIRIIDTTTPAGRDVDLQALIDSNSTMPLKGGELIYVPEREAVFAYVLGEVRNPGMKIFDEYEELTLERLISKAGGFTQDAGAIRVRHGDSAEDVMQEQLLSGDYAIRSGAVVNVLRAPERYVYVVSQTDGGRVEFSHDEHLTLRNALSKLNLLDITSSEVIQLVRPDGSREEVILNRLRYSDRVLEPGTVILYPQILRRVHVLGAVRSPGTVYLDLSEQMTLTSAISKAGGTLQSAEMTRLQITETLGTTMTVNLDRILLGLDEDPLVENDSLIFVPEYKPITVNVLGEVHNPGRVTFEKHESPNLLAAISKAGGLKDTASDEVRITTNNRTYNWFSLMSASSVRLENDYTVFVPKSDAYVYVVGASQSNGRVDFSAEEEMTLLALLGKLGGDPSSFSSDVTIIAPDGTVKNVLLDDVFRLVRHTELEPRSTVVFSDGTKRITVLGYVRNPGIYAFSPKEKTTLPDVIARAGGIPDVVRVEAILVDAGRGTDQYIVEDLKSRTEELPDLSFVYVVPVPAVSVLVLGDVRSPGQVVVDSTDTPSIVDAIAAAGGMNETAGKVTIIRGSEVISSFLAEDLGHQTLQSIQSGDLIMVSRDEERFVTVLGDVKNPGIFDISRYERVSVGLVLSLAGGLSDASSSGHAYILSDGKEQVVDISPERFTAVADKEVDRGSLVFIPPQIPRSFFVFGEVTNPGVFAYTTGINALEAIIRAGGPTQYGVMKNVVVFPGGIDADPRIVDLDSARKSGDTALEALPAGSIVYIPRSSIVNVKEILSIVGSSLSIVNSALNIAGHRLFWGP